jgi:hypothetical protein
MLLTRSEAATSRSIPDFRLWNGMVIELCSNVGLLPDAEGRRREGAGAGMSAAFED